MKLEEFGGGGVKNLEERVESMIFLGYNYSGVFLSSFIFFYYFVLFVVVRIIKGVGK